MKFLAVHGKQSEIRRKTPVIMSFLKTTSLVMARKLEPGNTDFFPFCPVVVSIGRLGLDGEVELDKVNHDSGHIDNCGKFESGVSVKVSSERQEGDVSVAVIYFEKLRKADDV